MAVQVGVTGVRSCVRAPCLPLDVRVRMRTYVCTCVGHKNEYVHVYVCTCMCTCWGKVIKPRNFGREYEHHINHISM